MIAIGIGCRRGASQEAITTLIEQALAPIQNAGEPALLFTIETKRGEKGLIAAARALSLPLEFLELSALRAVEDQIATPSPAAQAALGVASVSEAAALAGAGQGARLIAPRLVGDGVTLAVARGGGR